MITRWGAVIVALATFAATGGAAWGQSVAPIKSRIGYATALHGEIAKVLGKTDIGKRHGLDVEITFFQYGPPQIEGMVSKTLDVSFTSLVPTASYLAKQPGAVVVIAELGAAAHGLVVPAGSPVKSLADFRGKSIAVAFGTDAYVDLLASLRAVGLKPGADVNLVNVPPNEQPVAFEQKLTDGVLLRQPQLYKFIQKGAREIQRWPHHLWVIARADYLAANPGVRQRLVDAIHEAAVFVAANPSQAAAWFAEDLRLPADVIEKVAAQNPLFTKATRPGDVSVQVTPELKAFAARRAQDIVDFGVAKNHPDFVF
jgi:sulfonate transport system substrate-binding protein